MIFIKKRFSRFAATITISLASVFALSSCEALGPINLDLDKAYSFNLEINSSGQEEKVAGSFTRVSPGDWQGVLNSPYALQGLSVSYSGGEVTYSENGMTVILPNSEYNEKAGITAAELVFSAIESAVYDSGEAKYVGDTIEISGVNANGHFVLSLDKDTRLPISISVPEKNFKAEFFDASSYNFGSGVKRADSSGVNEGAFYSEFEDSDFE